MSTGERPYHHGDLRRTLVNEAIGLIREAGADALSLRRVAKRAGVSHAAPYRHFADKEALLAAVAVEGFLELTARIEAVPDGPSWVRDTAVAYVGFALDRPAHFEVMFSVPLSRQTHTDLGAVGRAAFDGLVAGVARAQAHGFIRAGDPTALGLTAWSTAHGLASLLVGGALPEARFGPPQAVMARVIPILVASLSPLLEPQNA